MLMIVCLARDYTRAETVMSVGGIYCSELSGSYSLHVTVGVDTVISIRQRGKSAVEEERIVAVLEGYIH